MNIFGLILLIIVITVALYYDNRNGEPGGARQGAAWRGTAWRGKARRGGVNNDLHHK